MKKILLQIVVYLMFGISSQSQTFNLEWQKAYGGSWTEDGSNSSIQNTSDGGFIIAGSSNSFDGDISINHGTWDAWVVKLDSVGNIEWEKSIGGTDIDQVRSIIQTSDGGYIFTGYSHSNDGDASGCNPVNGMSIWVVKLDNLGSVQWHNCYGSPSGSENGSGILQTSDGGYIIGGHANANGGDVTGNHGGSDFWVVKIDNSGSIQWQKSLGGTLGDQATFIGAANDGGFLLTGTSFSSDGDVSVNFGGQDGWAVKIDDLGNIQWEKSFGGSDYDALFSFRQTNDNGYILGGWAKFGNFEYLIEKLDSMGNVDWGTTVGGPTSDYGYDIIQTSDGNYLMLGGGGLDGGDVTGNHGGRDFWLVKLDTTGNILYQHSYGGTLFDNGRRIIQCTDSTFVMCGSTESNDYDVSGNHGDEDIWIVKLFTDNRSQLKFYHQLTTNAIFSSPQLIDSGWVNTPGAKPFNLCADGSEASYIEYHNNDTMGQPTSNIFFQIKNSSNPNEHGEFLTPTTTGSNVRKAVFRHPNYYNSTGMFKEDTIQITNGIGGNIIGEYPLRIYRAPVLLVHGLWSSRNAFNNMYNNLLGSKYKPSNCFKADYSSNDNNARDYFTNRYVIKYNINHTISMCLNEKISAGKVDIVAHSMGGLLSRFYLQSSWWTSNSDYRNDIHKLITLNTPHSGSQMANFLLNPLGTTYRNALDYIGKKSYLGAVLDLKVNSVPIDSILNLNSLNANLVPSTTIQTDGSSGGIDCSLLSHLISPSLNNTIFNGNPNDLIVEVASQQGGIILNPSLPNECHIGSTGNPSNIGLVDALLESDGNISPLFTTSGFQPPDLTSIYRLSGNRFTSSAGTIQITNPTNGQTFAAGATIPISISGASISKILLITGNQNIDFLTQDTLAQNATFQYAIPQEAIGDLKIVALGGDTSIFDCLDTITININVTATLDSISVYPSPIFIQVGEYASLDVTGYFNDGISRNINNMPGITYTIANTSVALHDNLNVIHGVSIDSTSIVISYLGQSKQVPLFVSMPDTNSTVGINNPVSSFEENTLSVYPNPNNGICTVKINSFKEETAHLLLLNPLGQNLFSESWDLKKKINYKQFNFEHLPNGIYFVIVKTKNSFYRSKIIKN